MQNKIFLLDTLLYFDIFNYPLTLNEFHTFLIGKRISKRNLKESIRQERFIEAREGLYYLKGKKNIVEQRIFRDVISREKRKIAEDVVKWLAWFPSIQSIALSGSVACNNAKEEDDIDLFIITSPNTMWITRFFVYSFLKITGKMRGKKQKNNLFCPNMFLSFDSLEINQKNIYTASEILHLVPLLDKNSSFSCFLTINSWVTNFFPNTRIRRVELKKTDSNRNVSIVLLCIEKLFYKVQFQKMKSKITHEKISEKRIQFHPNDLSSFIVKLYESRRELYGDLSVLHQDLLRNSLRKNLDHTPGS